MTAIEQLFQQPAAQAIGWALLQFVWQGALVGVLSALALLALKRSAADVRYVVATIGLTLMLTMPAVTAVQTWRSLTEYESSTASGASFLLRRAVSSRSFAGRPTATEPSYRASISCERSCQAALLHRASCAPRR